MGNDAEWTSRLTEHIRRACVWEVTARKPGNVHPEASFTDVCYDDFVRSAEVIAPVLAESRHLGVGRAIRESVAATRQSIGRNTNLGIILLIAPLSAVPPTHSLEEGIEEVLAGLTIEDAAECYAAIRDAHPGGLGEASTEDVATSPSVTLREAMQLAADRDRIAAQYANGFDDVLERRLGRLESQQLANNASAWESAIVTLHVQLMATLPDTLIARKCGWEVAHESARRAQRVLDAGGTDTIAGRTELQSLDRWLRADSNRRNPGATADLVAAILFAGLRDNRFTLPAIDPSSHPDDVGH